MSTFLQLCQKTAREAGIPGSGPSTTIGQTGQFADIVRWVSDSYIEIQNRHGGHWRFLRHEFTLTTASADDTYTFGDAVDSTSATAITRFSEWRFADRTAPPTIFLQSAGIGTQNWLIYADWEPFKQIYRISTQVDSYPAHITVDPQDQIVLGPQPNDIYVITGEYWRSAQVLAADADVPEIPTQFHDLIVWYALENYGYSDTAQEAINRAVKKKKTYMRQLERNQIERFSVARQLA